MPLALVFILITIVIDAMGIGLILPVMPALIEEITGGTLAEAAVWGGILASIFAVMQFLCGPALGALSDRYGRRPVLLIALGVLAVDYVIMALAGAMWLLLLGRVIAGITAATQSTASAFIADISAPEEKAARFGMVGAAFGIGFILGPTLGGFLAEWGTRAPFYAAAVLAACNMVFGYFVLPETVTDRIRRPISLSRLNPVGALAHVSKLPGLGRLLFMFFLYNVAFNVYPAIWAYFTKARFGWDERMVGISLSGFGIAMAIVQGVLIGVILRRLGDRNTVLYGLVFNFFAFAAMAVVTNGVIALILTPLTALGAVVTPALQGMMSRRVADNAQGELQGVLASIGALAGILSLYVMPQIFAVFTGEAAPIYLPGAPFVLSGALMIACGIVFVGRRRAPVA